MQQDRLLGSSLLSDVLAPFHAFKVGMGRVEAACLRRAPPTACRR